MVIAACLINMVVLGTYFAFGVFFKPMQTDFGWTSATTSGALSLSWIIQGLAGIFMGKLNDRFGPRLVLIFCGILLGAGYLLMSQANTIWQFYLFYGLIVGTGVGGSMVPLLSTTAKWFVQRRNIMTGIVAAGSGIGTLVIPSIVSRLISSYDWRMAYTALGITALVITVAAAMFLKRDPEQIGIRPYGEDVARGERPEIQDRAFSFSRAISTKQFWIAIAFVLSLGYCVQSVVAHIVPHAIELGIPQINAANYLAAIGGTSIIGRIVLGGTADRIGIKRTFIIAFILILSSLFWLVPATESWKLFLFVAVFGIARGVGSLVSPLIAELFGLKSHGLIFGIVAFGFTIGSAVGPFLTGYVFDATGTYQMAFLFCGAIATLGMILTSLLKRVVKR